MTKIKKIITLALGFILSVGTVGVASLTNNSRTNKANALEHDPLYNTTAYYWEDNSVLPTSGSVSLLKASKSRLDCHLDWTGEPENYSLGIEVHSRSSFNVFNAVYVTFAFPVNVAAYTRQTINFQWDLSIRRDTSDSETAYSSAELFYLGIHDVDYSLENDTVYYHDTDTKTETGSKNSLYRLATSAKNKKTYGSYDDNRVIVDNTTDSAKDFYLYFGFFTYCDGVSTTTNFTSMCGIRAKSTGNKNLTFMVGDQYFTNLTDACSFFTSNEASSIVLLKDYNCGNESVTINKTGSLDLNGHKIIRPNYTVDPLFTVTKSGTVLNLKSSATGGYIEIDYGSSVFDVNTNATLHIVDDIVIKNTSSSSAYCAIKVEGNGTCNIENGDIIGNRNAIIITRGTLNVTGGTIECSYGNTIILEASSSYSANLYISGSTALIKGNVVINGDLSKNNVYLKHANQNVYYTPTDATINVVVNSEVTNGNVVVRYAKETTATVNVQEVPGFNTELVDSNIVFKTRIYTVTARGDLFTLTGTLEFTYLQEDITFTVALKDVGELRRIDVYCDVLTQLVEGTDYEYSSATGVVTVYSSALKGDLSVRIYRIAEHVITFNANGGEGEIDPIIYKTGESVTIPGCSFTYKYHTFVQWNTKADGTGITIEIGTSSGRDSDYNLYAIWVKSDSDALLEFAELYMHFDTIDKNNNDFTGACLGEDGYYAIAKAAFEALDDSTKNTLMGGFVLKDVKARLLAWAAANGETYDPTTKTFVVMSSPYENVQAADFTTLLVITICALGGGLVLVLFKKKHN